MNELPPEIIHLNDVLKFIHERLETPRKVEPLDEVAAQAIVDHAKRMEDV